MYCADSMWKLHIIVAVSDGYRSPVLSTTVGKLFQKFRSYGVWLRDIAKRTRAKDPAVSDEVFQEIPSDLLQVAKDERFVLSVFTCLMSSPAVAACYRQAEETEVLRSMRSETVWAVNLKK